MFYTAVTMESYW